MRSGFARAAALGELDVDAIHRANETRNIARHHARLIGDDGERRVLAHKSQPLNILRRQGLLHQLHSTLSQDFNHSHGVVGAPGGVGVHAQ